MAYESVDARGGLVCALPGRGLGSGFKTFLEFCLLQGFILCHGIKGFVLEGCVRHVWRICADGNVSFRAIDEWVDARGGLVRALTDRGLGLRSKDLVLAFGVQDLGIGV